LSYLARNSLIISSLCKNFILYPINYQNIKTEVKNLFSFRRDSSSKLYSFFTDF